MNPGTSIISLVLLGWWTTSVTAEQVGLFTYSISNGALGGRDERLAEE